MENIIKIDNLSFHYQNKFIFDNLNLNVHTGEWLTIVGPNGSGKSTLLKILMGLIRADSNIIIDGVSLNENNLKHIREKIGFVFENIDNSFVGETVADDIAFALENLAYSKTEMNTMVKDIASLLRIDNLLDRDPTLLSGGEKQKVALAASLVFKPKILIIDDAFEMIDDDDRNDILNILDKLHKDEHLTIITVTHNLEETYKVDRMVVLYNGKILIEGPVKDVLKHDKIFNRIGIEVPFMVDLSLKLQLYGLIDHIILNMDEMVNALWK